MRLPPRSFYSLGLLALVPFGLLVLGQYSEGPAQQLTVQVLQEYPHDPGAYTQGLVFSNDRMFESTGLYGQSTLREVNYATGEVMRSISLPSNEFGEGLALVGNRLIQLTWKAGIAHVYDRDTFNETGVFSYAGEGWGLCYDGTRLIMSNGSDRLYFRSPDTFDVQTSVTVTQDGSPVTALNELEYAGGYVYANVYLTKKIVKIHPSDGHVVAAIDASNLDPGGTVTYGDVLNGIAYDSVDQTFFLTGKRWSKMYKAIFIPVTSGAAAATAGAASKPQPKPKAKPMTKAKP